MVAGNGRGGCWYIFMHAEVEDVGVGSSILGYAPGKYFCNICTCFDMCWLVDGINRLINGISRLLIAWLY